MRKKVYHLSSCNTCQRIINELGIRENFELQDVKIKGITAQELDEIAEKTGHYEALFNKRAKKYRANNLHEQELTEDQFRKLILEEYTFLKRPVIVIGDTFFVGNAKKTVAAAQECVNKIVEN